jgi:hypothetical protein
MFAVVACGSTGTTASDDPDAGTASPETPIATAMPPIGDPPAVDPGELTVPQPGQLDVREIPADRLDADIDGRAVTLRITFTSGVEPCYVLDTIVVQKGDHSFGLTLREGHGPGDMACIEIAKTKHALVELGELEPGTYTASDTTGGAAPIEFVIG